MCITLGGRTRDRVGAIADHVMFAVPVLDQESVAFFPVPFIDQNAAQHGINSSNLIIVLSFVVPCECDRFAQESLRVLGVFLSDGIQAKIEPNLW